MRLLNTFCHSVPGFRDCVNFTTRKCIENSWRTLQKLIGKNVERRRYTDQWNDRSAICVSLSKIIVSGCRHYPFMRFVQAPCTSMAPKSTIQINPQTLHEAHSLDAGTSFKIQRKIRAETHHRESLISRKISWCSLCTNRLQMHPVTVRRDCQKFLPTEKREQSTPETIIRHPRNVLVNYVRVTKRHRDIC